MLKDKNGFVLEFEEYTRNISADTYGNYDEAAYTRPKSNTPDPRHQFGTINPNDFINPNNYVEELTRKRRSEERMSDTATTAGETVQLQKGNGKKGGLKIVDAAKMNKEGIKGVVAKGILEKIEPNKYDPKKGDYFIRDTDDTLYIVRETHAVKELLGQPGVVGLYVELTYNGNKPSKKSLKGYNDFEATARKVK
jgi:hypothetical protein